jgi:hypothetical protein
MKQFYTDEELIRMVDNKPDATELERELAERLNKTLQEKQERRGTWQPKKA